MNSSAVDSCPVDGGLQDDCISRDHIMHGGILCVYDNIGSKVVAGLYKVSTREVYRSNCRSEVREFVKEFL